MIVGLTGSIGMGKSTVAAMFRDLGVPVFDADAEVHRLQGPGGALVAAIEAAFPGVETVDGIDRARLGTRVLGDDAAMAMLEGIVHPAVAEARLAFLATNHDAPVIVFDIPLLFEKNGADAVDAVVVVSAPADLQRARVLARPGMTSAKLDAILARQWPDADKRAKADHIIDAGTSLDATRTQVAATLACLRAIAGR